MHGFQKNTLASISLLHMFIKGKIGSVASKGCDLRKIPLKEFGPVKYP